VVTVNAQDERVANRAPKQERSRLTRQALLEAAVTCLATRGFSTSTVAVIAAEAGISRGAAQHHFPTREALLTAALEYMFGVRSEQVRADAVLVVPGRGKEEFVVARIVDLYSGPLFKAALQVWTAAAADEDLRAQILPLERKFARGAHDMAAQMLNADDSDPQTHRLIQATLDLARGLGLADVLTDDSKRRAKVAKAWAQQLTGIKTRD
jgi:AcrR family transcriptional regulator